MRPETVFENIYNLMRYGTTISNISEAGGVSTITTAEVYTLEDGMLVEISSKIYQISNLTRTGVAEYTFDIIATGLSASTWQLALYYEYGRAVEVGNTQHEKKEDPTNKNLLKDRKYLRPLQFDIWEAAKVIDEAFVDAQTVVEAVLEK